MPLNEFADYLLPRRNHTICAPYDRRKGFGRCPADEDYALEEGEDEASGDSEDVHSDDGLSDDTRGGGLNDILETSLDEEMREALLFTPLDPSPNPNPQCKTWDR